MTGELVRAGRVVQIDGAPVVVLPISIKLPIADGRYEQGQTHTITVEGVQPFRALGLTNTEHAKIASASGNLEPVGPQTSGKWIVRGVNLGPTTTLELECIEAHDAKGHAFFVHGEEL